MSQRRAETSIWSNWLAKLMSGDDSCYWAYWFKSNFINYEKSWQGILHK